MALEQPEEPAYEHTVGGNVFGVGKAQSVDALRAQNTLLRALLDEANKKERHAVASFNAAKLANAFLSNRMGKLELELTEFVAEVAKSTGNDGDGGDGGDGGATAGNGEPDAEAVAVELEALRAKLARAEEELMSTRRALTIVVNAFGRDAVVDKLQAATESGRDDGSDGADATHRKHRHDVHGHGGHRHHAGTSGKAAGAAGGDSEGHHRGHHHRHNHHHDERQHKHHTRHGSPSGADDVVVPAFIRDAIVQGNGVARSARVAAAAVGHGGGHRRRPHTTAPVTSPFASPPHPQADEFRTLHPLVPLEPNPVPVTDFLAEFRRGGTAGGGGGGSNNGSGAAVHRKSPVRAAPPRRWSAGRSPGADAYGGTSGGASVAQTNGGAAATYTSPQRSTAAASPAGGSGASNGAQAVSSYVRMASPGSAQAPGQELRQQVSAEVGSFIATFRSRVPASPPKHAPPPLPQTGGRQGARARGNGSTPPQAHARRDRERGSAAAGRAAAPASASKPRTDGTGQAVAEP